MEILISKITQIAFFTVLCFGIYQADQNADCPNMPITPSYVQPVLSFSKETNLPTFTQPPPPCPTNQIICLPNTFPQYPVNPGTTTIIPPENLIRCPPGTILIKGICRLVYCGTQSIYREGKCFKIECPVGTFWNGSRCRHHQETEEIVKKKIVFNSTLSTSVSSLSSSPIVINNVNNFALNNSSPISKTAESEETANGTSCCIVVTPRICKPAIHVGEKKWDCYSKRYHRCGNICVAPIVLLTTPTYSSDPGTYDCSDCVVGHPESCSNYCYKYICPMRLCRLYDQKRFCEQYPEEQGCVQEDDYDKN